jgi:outer membrane protein OmpA-like peptidoglycan-associated protein
LVLVALGTSLSVAQEAPTPANPAPIANPVASKPKSKAALKPKAPVPAPVLGPPVPVPAAPPPVPYIPPIDTAPPHPTAPPPPPPVHADAPGEASKIADGLRLTFGTARADFNPRTDAALRLLADAGTANPNLVYNVYAHAPGTAEDLSASRRLSLERALMVRSALINAGIASTRVYVHAMGAMGLTDGAPADRVDIVMATLDTARPLVAPTPPPAPPTGIPTPQ